MNELILTSDGQEPDLEQEDRYWVPESKRKDVDKGKYSDALNKETGDDMDGWKPGMPA